MELKSGSFASLKPLRILLVDDDDVDRERVVRCLRAYPAAIALTEAASLAQALAALAGPPFDLIIIDGFLGDGEGIDILAHLGSRRSICPVILVTGFSTERDAVDAIRVGVYDYIPKHQLHSELLSRVISNGLQWSVAQATMLEAERALRHRGLYDTLTELPNRNLFMDRLEQACATAARYGTPFAVMMMDLDRFKHVNDALGHAVGDQVLQHVGKRQAATFRQSDTVARLAGDEFASICQGVTSPGTAMLVAEKILTAVKLPVIVDGHALSVGISIGIALCPTHGTKPDYLLSVADKGMYQAKAGLKKLSACSRSPTRSSRCRRPC